MFELIKGGIGLGLVGALLWAGVAGAQTIDPLTQDYTSVSVEGYLPYKTSSLSSPHISVGSEANVGGRPTTR